MTAIEIDAKLAARARAALAPWPRVEVIEADGSQYEPEPADMIVASAGATHPPPLWLRSLKPGGRLLFPLTAEKRGGAMLLLTHPGGEAIGARFIRPVGFIEFAGARDPAVSARLQAAFGRGDGDTVRSLRRDAHAPDASCWLHEDGWCLSRGEPMAGGNPAP